MLFNSLHFALFLPVVFILYWFVVNKKLKAQNILLLAASYFFYACWDYRFLLLLIFSTLLDYYTGLKMSTAKNKEAKKRWFWLSIIVNVGFLGIFKYYNFFAESFTTSLSFIGLEMNPVLLSIVLPIGISFYTFHGLSYVIDIYNDRIIPERNIIDYSLFVSFFPLLVAGPIERATHLLPQIQKKRQFDYLKAIDGLRQILWGLFKKIVIADGCAEYANMIFNNSSDYSGSTLVLGAVFFAFQIYGDFSGYSDIALGVSRLFGIELIRNFNFPYFSRDIAEFWRRWHISLTTWFRDYLYIPLGGSQKGKLIQVRNTFIIFLVSGFWHGASWTFIVWGLLHAIYFLPVMLLNKNRNNLITVAQGRLLPSLREMGSMIFTFSLVVFGWIFFRATDLKHAIQYISEIFSPSILNAPEIPIRSIYIIAITTVFIIIEWIGREDDYGIQRMGLTWPKLVRWAFYYLLAIQLLGGKEQEFIYFQF